MRSRYLGKVGGRSIKDEVLRGVKCSMRLCTPRGKRGHTTEPGILLLSVTNLPLHMPNLELQEATGSLAVHRGLEASMGQKFHCASYFRSRATMI